MAYSSSLSASRDENRYRFQNTSLGTSRRHATREAARRISHTAPVHHSRAMSLAQDVDMVESPSQLPSHRTSSLPAELRRPAFRPISPAAIMAIEPDLEKVPLIFILEQIHDQGKVMFATACQTVTKSPKGRLPREMAVVINSVSAPPPTHVVAVYSQSHASQRQRISLHPIHGLVLAANCANLPPLPPSNPESPDYPGSFVSLPVIPLAIKSPETFPILIEYLYTQNKDGLLRSLLPVSAFGDIPPPAKLARELARTCPPMTLHMHLYRIQGVWSNVTALGVFDDGLWRTMVLAWEVLQDAFA